MMLGNSYGLAASLLLLVVLVQGLAPRRWAAPLALGAALLSLLPWHSQLAGIWYVRTWIGDLAPTTVLCLTMLAAGKPLPLSRPHVAGLAVLGALFYFDALSQSGLGLYGWGYHPAFMLAALAGLALLLWWLRQSFLLVLLGLGSLAYSLGLMESSNLWDYLLDPVLWLASLFALAKKLRRPVESQSP